MVNELRNLLHESSDNAPYDAFDPASVVRAGRSRNRRRRATMIGAAGLAAAAVIGSTVVLGALISDKPDPASPSGPNSEPVGPVLRLSDASPADLTPAFESFTDLGDVNTTRFLDGVTEDGRAIVRDSIDDSNRSRLTLVDLATRAEDPMPDIPGQVYVVLEANEEHIVYGADRTVDVQSRDRTSEARAFVLDLANETWRDMRWPNLPQGTMLGRDIGPDGRLYVAINTDADAMSTIDPDGMTGDLWSVSLTDPDDVRDEDQVVGNFAIDGNHLVWSELSNGMSNRLTVRDLETGEETSFDPHSGAYCTQSSLGVDADRIVMFQSCVAQNGITDDRIQVVSMTGEPMVTIQDAEIDGYVDGGGHVMIRAQKPKAKGTYSYDLATGDFLRLSTTIPGVTVRFPWPVSDGWLMWTEGSEQVDSWMQKVAQLP